ncbi:hypothetical protein SF83666_c22940 [Sinorhizobium fredii CCBAU 83666]|nr:hypothetical protein SF83666_c22940 [Sinorhizobium fredii CCBAU 83666]
MDGDPTVEKPNAEGGTAISQSTMDKKGYSSLFSTCRKR